MVAEPWDIGTYQVGNFPVDWSEWNGKFRDTMRSFGKGDAGTLADVGRRLTGSADLYGEDGRSAFNSINFITCHDGFTLNDLVSYNGKHNEKTARTITTAPTTTTRGIAASKATRTIAPSWSCASS